MGDPNSWMVHSGKSDSSCLKWQIYGYNMAGCVFFNGNFNPIKMDEIVCVRT